MSKKIEEGSSDSDDDDEEYQPTDSDNDIEEGVQDGDNTKNVVQKRIDSENISNTTETEDERQKRLELMFCEFIGGDHDEPKLCNNMPLSTASSNSELESAAEKKISESVCDSMDDIFGPKCDDSNILLNVVQSCDDSEMQQSVPVKSRKRKPSTGLVTTINALSKKSKRSILETTAKDWGAFKVETGIQDELTTHNRGKQGYIDRIEFLTRTDYRQFEMERAARDATRNKK
ncbi:unnamed protein product [Thelazia callipaeda]|uniref:Craniofacial development protein 1 n=1 Tax=Thelazia callipaeda TaxID=103827 RepID=A0A0N5CUY0_THECL|nr:unnamed protein product [Thelazia callipaeda]